jgi:hypothetical protein
VVLLVAAILHTLRAGRYGDKTWGLTATISFGVAGTTTTASTTTTTASTTTNTVVQALHARLGKLEAMTGGSEQMQDVVAAVEELAEIVSRQAEVTKQHASQLDQQARQIAALVARDAVRDEADAAAAKAAANRDTRVDDVLTTLGAFIAPLATPVPSSGCTNDCVSPTVEADDAGTLTLRSAAGTVILDTPQCGAMDLCTILQMLQTFFTRFDSI